MICWLYNPDVSWCASSFLSWNYGKGSPAAPFWAEHGRTMTQGRSLVSGRTAPRMLCAECITRTMKRKPWIAWLRWRRFMKISHAIRITYTHIWCICIIINTIYKLYIYIHIIYANYVCIIFYDIICKIRIPRHIPVVIPTPRQLVICSVPYDSVLPVLVNYTLIIWHYYANRTCSHTAVCSVGIGSININWMFFF
jgi:hypothetical protein